MIFGWKIYSDTLFFTVSKKWSTNKVDFDFFSFWSMAIFIRFLRFHKVGAPQLLLVVASKKCIAQCYGSGNKMLNKNNWLSFHRSLFFPQWGKMYWYKICNEYLVNLFPLSTLYINLFCVIKYKFRKDLFCVGLFIYSFIVAILPILPAISVKTLPTPFWVDVRDLAILAWR